MIDVAKITGVGDYTEKTEVDTHDKKRTLYYRGEKAFLVINPNTVEVRTDAELLKLLTSKYESVMQSRYFGRGGIEIVLAGKQFSATEIEDLIRLSYNLTD